MGKKGKIKLILPKNSSEKLFFEKVIQIIFSNGGRISAEKYKKEMIDFMIEKNVGSDITSVIHKAVMPRYLGLVVLSKRQYFLTEFGYRYANAKSKYDKFEVIFDAISSITFGRENNAVSSDSDVEPPILLLKLIKDKSSISTLEFGLALYYLEVLELDYLSCLNRLKKIKDLKKEKSKIIKSGGGKLFDPKINAFFKSLGIINYLPNEKKYGLNSYISAHYGDVIERLGIFNYESKKRKLDFGITKKDLDDKLSLVLKNFEDSTNFSLPSIQPLKVKNIKNLSSKRKGGLGGNTKPRSFSKEDLFKLGWGGEKYIYLLLNKNNTLLLNELLFSRKEEIKNIDWFNIGYENEKNWEDKSIGKGFDILLETNKRSIKIEVKTSFESAPFYYATSNELKSMNHNRDDYFLIKLNKFKYVNTNNHNPELIIIQDPIRCLKNIYNIKEIQLYTTV